jgi:hypothetical protein
VLQPAIQPQRESDLHRLRRALEALATARIVELREKFAIGEIREVKPGAEIRVKDRVVPQM